MNYESILYEKKDKIGLIKLNRPKVLNAYSEAISKEMVLAVDQLSKDPEVRVVVSTGSGRAIMVPLKNATGPNSITCEPQQVILTDDLSPTFTNQAPTGARIYFVAGDHFEVLDRDANRRFLKQRRGRGQRETDFPRAGFEVAQSDEEGAVERNGEFGRRGFQPAGGGVRAEFAAKNEGGDAVEGRKAELAGFAEPSGVGREIARRSCACIATNESKKSVKNSKHFFIKNTPMTYGISLL